MTNDKPPPIATSTTTIKIDHRESRSGPNHAIQKLVKLLSPLIMNAAKAEPAGSPRLTAPDTVHKHCRIVEFQQEDVWLYRLSKADELETSQKPKGHKLFYFAGGGFRGKPTKEHWQLCEELCLNLPEYEVNLVSYPLAPNSPAHTSIVSLQKLYRALEKQARTEKSKITLAGDSAGGNLAIVMGIFGATEYLQNADKGEDGACVIESIMAISPVVDHRNQNPHIDTIDPLDPILSRKVIEEVSEAWKGDWEVSDPRVSPILADLTLFRQAGIKVDGVIALYDVLSPDAIEFVKMLSEHGVWGEWLQWEKQMHCFPIMFSYRIHEAVAAKDWILDVLHRRAQTPKHQT